MTVAYWIVAGALALGMLGAGFMKLTTSKEKLHANGMGYVEDFSTMQIKLIGLAEVLGAVGLILPKLFSIAPILSPVAALCLLVLMVGAVAVHVRRKEPFVPPLALGALAVAAAILGFLTLP